MTHLAPELRSQLEKAVLSARDTAEAGAKAALQVLGVEAREAFTGISNSDRRLRVALRARARALGQGNVSEGMPLLMEEVAYEQWHHMLFARFLAENRLLIHPEHGVAVSLDEVAELAREAGESDPWLVAARYAERMLPGIFRTDDPSAQVSFAPDQRQALERILAELPPVVFTADDALGWVYQFWQTKRKKEVNASGRKIGGADIAPVTQLFTEPYMVRFLLENSLGAWWVSRHPDSPLREQWEYLRFRDDGTPAAGTFAGWPRTAAEVTVMDPCCGSGHFLVVAADMLRQMRMAEEGLSGAEAGDAVLRDNLFGLELDPRCTQIAAFALAFDAWRYGGYRVLPVPNIACSGIAVRGQLEDWTRLAGGNPNLVHALTRLYELFKDAPDLGSLIDPTALSTGGLFDVDPGTLLPLLEKALAEETNDPAAAVLGAAAEGAAKAARLLAGKYWLLATNPPFLGRDAQSEVLREFADRTAPAAKGDLATLFIDRFQSYAMGGGTYACVSPQNWLYLASYRDFRRGLVQRQTLGLVVRVGERGFDSLAAAGAFTALSVITNGRPARDSIVLLMNVADAWGAPAKAAAMRIAMPVKAMQVAILDTKAARISESGVHSSATLDRYADSYAGLQSGDYPRYSRMWWEVTVPSSRWAYQQGTVDESSAYSGRERVLDWRDGRSPIRDDPGARVQESRHGAELESRFLRCEICRQLCTPARSSAITPLLLSRAIRGTCPLSGATSVPSSSTPTFAFLIQRST